MTTSTSTRGEPGRRLLWLAALMFGDRASEHLFGQTIADLRQEVREAGDSSSRAWLARAHGYVAYWRLFAAVLYFGGDAVLTHEPAAALEPRRSGGVLFLLLGAALFAATWPLFGWFVVAAVAAGTILAIALRQWYMRHPAPRPPSDPLVAVPAAVLFAALWPLFGWFILAACAAGLLLAVAIRRWNSRHPSRLAPSAWLTSARTPEINISAIPVGGDIGGLFFVLGSLLIVMLGLPPLRWFVAGVVAGGILTAVVLFIWRSTQPSAQASATSIRP